jgi:hypothetical protein
VGRTIGREVVIGRKETHLQLRSWPAAASDGAGAS